MKIYTMSQILEFMPDAKIDNSLFSMNLTIDIYGQFLLTTICAGRSRTFFLHLEKIQKAVVDCLDLLENCDSISLSNLPRQACRAVVENNMLVGIGHLTKDRFIKFDIMEIMGISD